MHVAFGQFSSADRHDADIHVELDSAAPDTPWQRSAYGSGRRFNPASVAVVVGVHAALFAALVTLDIVPTGRAKSAPIVVDMLAIPQEPPPSATPPPPEQATPEPLSPIQTPIVSPPPLVRTIAAPPPVLAAAQATPEPPAPVTKAAAAPAPAPPAPVQEGPLKAGDLLSKVVSGKPPKYPFESRKKKEVGTVVLRVLITTGGAVESISVSKSSGFSRLDSAALETVKKWRFSPTLRDGEPVMVSGLIPIPFVLTT